MPDNGLPVGWERLSLGQVSVVSRGLTWSHEQESSSPVDGAVPVVRIGNVQRDGFRMDDTLYVTGVSANEKTRRAISQRTVVMVGSNGNRDRVGNAFLATEDVRGHLYASFLIGIEPLDGVSERYLTAYLRSERVQSLITGATAGSTGLKNLSLEWLRALNVDVPPLDEQRRIAEVLDSIDAAIEKTEAVIAATERLRSALLGELLTRGVPGWHTEWKQVPGIGMIPACWDVVRLGDFVWPITSGSRAWARYYSTAGALFVRSQNIGDGTIDFADRMFVTPPDDAEAKRTRISPGNLLISITGDPGHVTVADESLGEAYASQHVALIKLKERPMAPYVSLFLTGDAGRGQFQKARYGQTRPGLNLLDIARLMVALPPATERDAIASGFSLIQARIAAEKDAVNELASLKTVSAAVLLSGRVRVTDERDS